MWIFLNNAFLSIVDKGGDGSTLLVRARIDRETVALAMAEVVKGIRYSNFKDSVRERSRHDAYMDVWSAMHRYRHHGG